MKKITYLVFILWSVGSLSQEAMISGKVVDESEKPISFVNVLLFKGEETEALKGTTTDENGAFVLGPVAKGDYVLKFSFIGYEPLETKITTGTDLNLKSIVLKEAQQVLEETVITAKKPTIQKSPGKLIFNVENSSLSVGSTFDLLKKTPGVLIIGESIQVKLSAPVIYIDGKRVYLSDAEVISLLQGTDASAIKAVEVITNPSAKYDAETGTVLNIVTSKAISIGYKGSVNTTYDQAIYPKFNFGTSHFYKNNWINMYASYNYGPRKEFKEEDTYIRFFEPDMVSTKSIWETYFNRTTDIENHNGNVVLDFTLDEKNSLSATTNLSLSPETTYDNYGHAAIFGPDRELDSTFVTQSDVAFKKENVAASLDYHRELDNEGSSLALSANYIYYNHAQDQNVRSDYFLADGSFLRTNEFYTDSKQNSNIFTGQADLSTNLWGGTFQAGYKFSNINTESNLHYYGVHGGTGVYYGHLSDDFNYRENIYAEYLNYEKEWEKWSISLGLRGEYTDIEALSVSLGEVNAQQYFDIFPSGSVHLVLNENNGLGLSYGRNVHRPRYESLNPFKYFITESNYKSGNPKLQPSIEDRITLSFDHKNKFFIDVYYENIENSLDVLAIQNNEYNTLKSVDSNLERSYQYAFDLLFYDSLTDWWWLHVSTSTFYLANEFYLEEIPQTLYKNDTFGQYIAASNNFALSKDRSFSAYVSGLYLSSFAAGNRQFKNQSYVNISFRKEFWDKRASLTVGVDDIFDTLDDVASVAQYYNQDNRFLVNGENRLLRVGFKYNFGNARLRDNNKDIDLEEKDRLK